ncbi:glycosyltransferase [Candidatus Woesearchaeota archaeon]|nr:glycosyltransferase [Candidatus Woesearchaeota archaeon]
MGFVSVLVWVSYVLALYFLVYWLLLFFENRHRIKDEWSEEVSFKSYPFVSVVVPAYNEEATIRQTVESLFGLDWPKDRVEFLIIDDGSRDRTSAIVKAMKREFPQEPLKLVRQENQGKATALNNGLDVAKGKYYACLDADSFVDPDALKHIIYWHEKHPDMAIATPVMKIATPKTWVQKFQRLEYMAGMLLTRLMSYVHSNYVAPGPFSIYKKDVVKKLGGFDKESLVEDQEIAYRAQMGHYRIMQVPNAFVHTVGPYTVKQLQNQRNRWMKGTLMNLVKYRRAIFNRKYGDFGIFQLPLNMAQFALSLVAVVAFLFYVIKPLARHVHELWLVNFDLIPYLQTLSFNMHILQLRVTPVFILVLMLVLGAVFLFLAGRINKDRVRQYGTLHIVPYFFVFYLILAFIAIKVMAELAVGKKQKW